MNQALKILFIFWGLLLVFSFSIRKVNPDEYLSIYKESSFIKQKNKSSRGVIYSITFVPIEVRVIQQYRKGQITKQQASNFIEKYSDSWNFILNIDLQTSKHFLQNSSDYYDMTERVKYFSFEFQNDIIYKYDMEVQRKIIDYNFERNFSLSPQGTILFSVPKKKAMKNLSIELFDKVYGQEKISFMFQVNDFESLPKLKKVKKWKK